MPRRQPRPIADEMPDQHHGWPLDTDRAAAVACSVELDLSDRTVELVRILVCGAYVALRTSVWSRTYESATHAEDAFAALDANQADLLHWSVAAVAFGPDWLDTTIDPLVVSFVEERDEERARRARELEKGRRRLEEERTAETRISAYFREKKGRYLLDFDRGCIKAKPILSVAFKAARERADAGPSASGGKNSDVHREQRHGRGWRGGPARQAAALRDGRPSLGRSRPAARARPAAVTARWRHPTGSGCDALRPGIDHVPGLRRFVAEACRRRALSGLEGYHQPPQALLGENGIGKGFVAYWIARNAGVPLFRMPVGRDFGMPSVGHGVERRIPPLPIVAMAAARCANPVIVVELDVDDPITDEAEDVLISMIDPRANSRWIDPEQRTILDLSHVSWIVEVQGRRLHRSGVRNPDERRPIEAVLPSRLEAVIHGAGAVFRLAAVRELVDLRILDVAIGVCAASSVADPDVVADVHRALLEPDRHWFDFPACGDLVRTAGWALVRRWDGDVGR